MEFENAEQQESVRSILADEITVGGPF